MIYFPDNNRDNIVKGTFQFDNETTLEKKMFNFKKFKKIKLTFDEVFQRNL